jgi:outer membrane lipoprotein-sorting protein
MYDDRGTGKRVVLLHAQKRYVLENITLTEEGNRKHANFQDPTWWVQKFLTCVYAKLERREIDGTLCDGIETTDTALVADHDSRTTSLVARLWVSVETGYPVLFEGEFHGSESGNVVFDQFQWNVELEASLFEPKIPADYIRM